MARRKKYGILRFMFDFSVGVFTGGLWWAYLGFRFVRANS